MSECEGGGTKGAEEVGGAVAAGEEVEGSVEPGEDRRPVLGPCPYVVGALHQPGLCHEERNCEAVCGKVWPGGRDQGARCQGWRSCCVEAQGEVHLQYILFKNKKNTTISVIQVSILLDEAIH